VELAQRERELRERELRERELWELEQLELLEPAELVLQQVEQWSWHRLSGIV
jgi:hypothetical protein